MLLPDGTQPGGKFETEMFPGGPQPLIHHAGAPICLPHSLFALMKNGLLMSMPRKFVSVPVGSG